MVISPLFAPDLVSGEREVIRERRRERERGDACHVVKGQVVKVGHQLTGKWEIQVFRSWTNGERSSPNVQCLHEVL